MNSCGTPEEGYRVVGACVPSGAVGSTLGTTAFRSSAHPRRVVALRSIGADTVAVTSSDDLGARRSVSSAGNSRAAAST